MTGPSARRDVGEGQSRFGGLIRATARRAGRSLAVLTAAFQFAWGGWIDVTSRAEPPARLAQVPAVPMAGSLETTPQAAAIPPRNTGPQAMAHSRYRRGRHGTTRIIRRTPAVMREDAARVKRGDLFSTWSNEYIE